MRTPSPGLWVCVPSRPFGRGRNEISVKFLSCAIRSPIHFRCSSLLLRATVTILECQKSFVAQRSIKSSHHWGLSPGPSVYKTDALPLSYSGSGTKNNALLDTLRPSAPTPSSPSPEPMHSSFMARNKAPPVGLEPTIFGLEVRRLVH